MLAQSMNGFNTVQRLRRSLVTVGLALLLLTSGGCKTIAWLNPTLTSRPIDLAIVQVEPETSGSYTVSGNTTLPDKTQITVSAVRYFKDGTQAASAPERNYAILDRQIAEVTQGSWETRLNLWQSSANGQFQEAWQVKFDPNQRIEPEADVTFLATLEPANQPASLKKQVEALESSQQVAAITRFTTDGELYLQAVKTLSAPPPQGRSSAVLKAVNSAPDSKPRVVKSSSNAAEAQQVQQQTDLPLSPDAFVR